MARTSSPNSKQAPPKRGKPLPYIEAVADQLPWTPGYGGKVVGQIAVADRDLDAGTLVLEEEAFVTITRSLAADRVCHACFKAVPPRQHPKKEGETEAGKEERTEMVDPMEPRYCSDACARSCAVRDLAIAPLRAAMQRISTTARVDPELLALVVLLEFLGTGLPVQPRPKAQTHINHDAESPSSPFPLCASSVDVDLLNGNWDKRPAKWRKVVGAALRALHKELVLLATSGSVRAYTSASPLLDLQRRAAMLAIHLTGIGPAAETGLGLFPGLTAFSQSCIPNCVWFASGSKAYVRTTVPVPAGTALTASLVSLHEPRRTRQAVLSLERGITCACERCLEPIEKSNDRFLEGVWCLSCRRDVLVLAPNQEEAADLYLSQEASKTLTTKASKGQCKNNNNKGAHGKQAAKQGAESKSPKKESKQDDGCTHDHHHTDGSCCHHDHASNEKEAAPLTWWKCCGCDAVVPGVAPVGLGPEEVTHRATLLWQQGVMLHNVNALQQSEQVLRVLAGGLSGRLHPLHSKVIDAITPLLNISIQRGDSVAVFNLALQLWEAERAVVDRPTLSQLTYLNALVDAAQHKATHANSSVVRKQFDRKFKLAQGELVFLKKLMLGVHPKDNHDPTFTASRVF